MSLFGFERNRSGENDQHRAEDHPLAGIAYRSHDKFEHAKRRHQGGQPVCYPIQSKTPNFYAGRKGWRPSIIFVPRPDASCHSISRRE
jgi:hypothetical protein